MYLCTITYVYQQQKNLNESKISRLRQKQKVYKKMGEKDFIETELGRLKKRKIKVYYLKNINRYVSEGHYNSKRIHNILLDVLQIEEIKTIMRKRKKMLIVLDD